MPKTTMYRIKLRGAFPHVTPRYVDKPFANAIRAAKWAYSEVERSLRESHDGTSYTRYEVFEVGPRGLDGDQVAKWVAGE